MAAEPSDVWIDDVLRIRWDDENQVYTEWDAQGVLVDGPRPYTPEESAWRAASARQATLRATRSLLVEQLATGIAAIKDARQAAANDIAVAEGLHDSAVALSGQISTHLSQIQAATPAATLAYITAMRDAIATVVQRQKTIVDAMASMYQYRQNVDANAVLTDDAILWLARLISNTIVDEDE